MNASTSPAQLLLARTPPTPSNPTATSATSRYRHGQHHHHSLNGSPSNNATHRRTPSAPLIIHPTFSRYARNPGTVKITVQDTTYYVHKDILQFGSSFFEALLTGSWLETSSDAATSFVGGNQPLGMSERRWSNRNRFGEEVPYSLTPESPQESPEAQEVSTPTIPENFNEAQLAPVPRLSVSDPTDTTQEPPPVDDRDAETTTVDGSFVEEMQELGVELQERSSEAEEELVGEKTPYDDFRKKVEARVVLREEKASAFQDLLFFIYPHLDCIIHWNNVAELMTMAQKFDIPLLRRQCVQFLMTSAAGKPIMAMKVAEDHALPELYREASRYLLDSWSIWEQNDLTILSEATLLKLEKRRTWFLERLLKLGLVNTQRDYVCTSACPDPQICARMLDEKWRSAWSSAFRYGSPNPSSIYRILRLLEPSLASPALHLPHTSCQNHAKAWVADFFDRMFSLGVPTQRSFVLSGTTSRAPYIDPSSTKKYFLYIDWKNPVV